MTDQEAFPEELFQELHALAEECVNGTATPQQVAWLDRLMIEDERARKLYVRYVHTLCGLRTWSEYPLLDSRGDALIPNEHEASPPVPPVPFLFTAFHSTIGYFSEGMPLAYLLATVVTGLGLLIGSHIYVSHPEHVARNSAPSVVVQPKAQSVGRITGMVDCKWEKEGSGVRGQGSDSGDLKSFVSLGQKFALASGLMEISYYTGAKVILQGPATYEVESNGGFLSVGKLTGKLEKRDKGPAARGEKAVVSSSFIVHPSSFVIRTPTATVTDLGTEFGVEVAKDGAAEVHVLAGQVELATRAGTSRLRLIAGSRENAARVEADGRKVVKLSGAPMRFVWTTPKPPVKEAAVVDWSWNQPNGLFPVPDNFFTVADDDLLQTHLASVSTDDVTPPPFEGQALSALYDGRMYGPRGDEYATTNYSFSARNGKSVTFALDTGKNRQGYTIDSIDVYTGYVYYQIGQKYKVEFAKVGQAGWLSSPVVRVDRQDVPEHDFWEACSHIRNPARDAPLITHVGRIRFTFYDQESPKPGTLGRGVYREIDVFGSPTASAETLREPTPHPATKRAQP